MEDDFDVEAMLEAQLEEKARVKSEPKDDDERKKGSSSRRERSRSREKDRKRSSRRKSSRSRSRKRSRERKKRSRSRSRKRSRTSKRSKSRDRKRSRSKDRKSIKKRSKSRERSKKKSRSKERERRKSVSPVQRIDTSHTLEDRDSRTVLAMQLSQKTKEKDLKEFFSVVGDVRSVKMIQDRHSRRSKAIGIAYIEFKYSQSVPLALGLNGQQVNGIPIIVQQSQAEKNRHAQMVESAKQTLSKLGNGPIKLKVTNLIDEITEEMFRTIFEPFGRLDSVELIDDPITGKSAGSGFITFSDCDAGKTALKELDRFDLGGKRIRVSVVDKVITRNREAKEDVKALEDSFDGSVGRIALMNKLAARTDLLNQKEEEPVPKPVAKPVQAIETRCFQLSNMFNPTKEKTAGWENDIRDDVILELSDHGGALHVHVDKFSKDGNVFVMALSPAVAQIASKKVHGNYFDGKMIQAAYIPEASYVELFPESADANRILRPA